MLPLCIVIILAGMSRLSRDSSVSSSPLLSSNQHGGMPTSLFSIARSTPNVTGRLGQPVAQRSPLPVNPQVVMATQSPGNRQNTYRFKQPGTQTSSTPKTFQPEYKQTSSNTFNNRTIFEDRNKQSTTGEVVKYNHQPFQKNLHTAVQQNSRFDVKPDSGHSLVRGDSKSATESLNSQNTSMCTSIQTNKAPVHSNNSVGEMPQNTVSLLQTTSISTPNVSVKSKWKFKSPTNKDSPSIPAAIDSNLGATSGLNSVSVGQGDSNSSLESKRQINNASFFQSGITSSNTTDKSQSCVQTSGVNQWKIQPDSNDITRKEATKFNVDDLWEDGKHLFFYVMSRSICLKNISDSL